jgi:LytS/YehU family sensor histidine kinase
MNGKVEAMKVLSTAYGKQQNYNKALELYQDYVSVMDAIYKKREADILASIQITTTLNRKLERLDLIEKDLEVSRKTVDLLHQEQLINLKEMKVQRMFTYSLSAALLILTIASIFILRSSNLKRKANQLLALRSLRSQMNPHFIYNSLNSVNSYISKNDEKAANKYLSDFSRLMRTVMENSKLDFVPLTSEIETIRIYLALEQSRFSDKFEYSFTVDETLETDSINIPPMLIQPFIENAIWHGLRYRDDKGMLLVGIKKFDDTLQIIVEDNGIGRKKSEELKTRFQKGHASTGLMNIENRINIINHLFHAQIDLKIVDLEEQNNKGTRVFLCMPLRTKSS